MTLEELFTRRHLAVFRYLRRMSGRDDVAEELTAEVFLRAVKAWPGYRETGQANAWIFRIAHNVWCSDRRRRAGRGGADDEVESLPGSTAIVERLVLADALAQLQEDERACFLLREVGGLGYAEIAAAVSATPDAVRSRIHRARVALRAALGRPAWPAPRADDSSPDAASRWQHEEN